MKYLVIVLGFVALALINPINKEKPYAISTIQTRNVSQHRAVVSPSPKVPPAPVASAAPQSPAAAVPAPATQPAPQLAIGCSNYLGYFNQYAWNVHVAVAICQAESGGNPNAISPANYDGLRDYGLMQIHGQYILDPALNVAVAYHKYLTQGWDAWTTYTSGKYAQYL